ncbi:hypothetical protein [uncultured Dysosmobacter sp.]|uniref:hypothetical protein n=1 Tax=uncultured Dysosmobacter sp. TaxID=2591384 RepID=UPI00262AF4EC|nr:hypothetical protein [uncultured Dysosmobacter sp.]
MSFRKLQGVNIPEEKQGAVRFACLTAEDQPKIIREKIERLCHEVGGPYSAALRDVMCSRKSITAIAVEHHVSESTLYRMRKEFYESWYRRRA